MTNRQKRLCRILLDFYDASGAQPCPLAQLARKAGYDASDIYDKDSQSGDLWPFDAKARGNYSGMLLFTGGKSPTVTITSAGLVSLENLCGDAPAAAAPAKISELAKPIPAPARAVTAPPPVRAVTTPPTPPPMPIKTVRSAKPFPTPSRSAASVPPISPKPNKVHTAPAKPPSSPSFPSYSSSDIAEGWSHFIVWLDSDPAASQMLESFQGRELIEVAFGKFLGDFLKHRSA